MSSVAVGTVGPTNGCFLTALQPSNSACTAYMVPSDLQIIAADHHHHHHHQGVPGPPATTGCARARRVQEQVRMRLAEKKSSSLPRLNGSVCGSTDHGSPSYRTFSSNQNQGGFSSRSMVHTPSRVMAVATGPLPSSRSAVDLGVNHQAYRGGASQLGVSVLQSSYQTSQSHRSRTTRSKSISDPENLPPAASLLVPPGSPAFYPASPALGAIRRSLSGTLGRGGGVANWQEEELSSQHAYRGPSHRTISRITNRQPYQHQPPPWGPQDGLWGPGGPPGGTGSRVGSMAAGGSSWGGAWQQQQQQQQQVSRGGGAGSVLGAGHQYQASIHRAASLHSMRSVGKGADVMDAASTHSNDPLGIQAIDMPTAVRYLSENDAGLQVLGSAYIQHQCYHSNEAKNQVRSLGGVSPLVQLFSSENQEVQRFSSGAVRNLIYENQENKAALIDAGGVARLVGILKEPDEELRKNITGILWNLSSKDNLKEKLSREVLSELTDRVLVPLCSSGEPGASLTLSPSEKDIFYNTTGCLRNLSSINERTRQQMREMRGLVDSLVCYTQSCLQEEQSADKGLENTVCILRNLSYQLYSELPPSSRQRLDGPSRGSAHKERDVITGCFTVHGKKRKEQRNQELSVFSEVSRPPRGGEWLWHPQVVALYKGVVQSSAPSPASREAAVGALQNITAGDARWAAVISHVILDQERLLPVLLDLLDSTSDLELRPLTGLLRNLARHTRNKDHMAKSTVNVLLTKLPSDGTQKDPSGEVVVNICGALNHLVTGSSLAARDISYFDGLPKLVGIKTTHDNSSGRLKAAKAASTVLCNMFQYNKLHKDYKQKGFARKDFTDATI